MPFFWSPKASVSMMANLPSATVTAPPVGTAARGCAGAGVAGRAAGWVWAEAVSAAKTAKAAAKRVLRIFMIFPVLLLGFYFFGLTSWIPPIDGRMQSSGCVKVTFDAVSPFPGGWLTKNLHPQGFF